MKTGLYKHSFFSTLFDGGFLLLKIDQILGLDFEYWFLIIFKFSLKSEIGRIFSGILFAILTP